MNLSAACDRPCERSEDAPVDTLVQWKQLVAAGLIEHDIEVSGGLRCGSKFNRRAIRIWLRRI
jgi:hypothetical protein